MSRRFFYLILLIWMLLIAGILQAKPRIFVSILPQRYFIQRIAPQQFDIDVMVTPGSNPATYEPTPHQMARLATASLYFSIGVPFEEVWLDRMQKANPQLHMVAMEASVPRRAMADAMELFDSAPHGDHHHEADDPHVWLNTQNVSIMAKTIAQELSARYPEKTAEYEANLAQFTRELSDLHTELSDKFSHLTQRRFLVFHPSWGYFASEFGLQQIPIEIQGKEPTTREMVKIIDFARQHDIRVIFVQKQFSKAMAESVAQSIAGSVVSIDPLAEDFMTNLRQIGTIISQELQ